jgi:hypothetical protein
MSTSLLVRHPAPSPNESIFGYVLRLSEENGYSSPWGVFKLAGLKQSESIKRNFEFEKLAAIANCTTSKTQGVMYSESVGRPDSSRILDASLHQPADSTATAHFCPQCVAENGFIEFHWSLPLMVACPIHKCLAASHCPQCGKKLTWFRPGLLECTCGANLLDCDQTPVTEREACILNVLRQKALNNYTGMENPVAFPLNDLIALDLATLIRVINSLARHQMETDGCYHATDERQIINTAARVLEDWPKNFVTLLKEVGRNNKNDSTKKKMEQCKRYYRSLLNDSADELRERIDFLLRVIIEVAVDEWGYSDSVQLKRFQDKLPTGVLSVAQLTAGMHDGTRTSARTQTASDLLVSRKAMESLGAASPDAKFIQGYGSNCTKVIDEALAASLLGIDRDMLLALIENQIYEVHHIPSGMSGCHVLDIISFEKKIVALAPLSPISGLDVEMIVSLDTALSWRWDSIKTKVALLQALLAKVLPVIGNLDGTIGGLLMDRSAYHKFIGSVRSNVTASTQSAREAARFLKCDRITIPGLVRLGTLRGSESPMGLRVEADSLEKFKEEFVFLSVIARIAHTNTEKVRRRCNRSGIPVMWPRQADKVCKEPFIRSADVDKLMLAFSKEAPSGLASVKKA